MVFMHSMCTYTYKNTDILFNTVSDASNEPGFPTALPNPQG